MSAAGPVRASRGTHRTGVVRGGAGRTTTAGGGGSLRSVGHRALPSESAAPGTTSRSSSFPLRGDLRLVGSSTPARDRGRRPRSRRLPFALLVLALLVGTTLSLLVLNTTIAVDSLKATSLRQQNEHRQQELQRLQQEVVEGSTVPKLAGEAAEAGLVPAGTAGYLVVEPDGTSTFRGAPEPATGPPVAPPPSTRTRQPTGTTGGN